jgi:hypothetical protein
MTSFRKSLVLAKMAEDSRPELKAMTAELSGQKSESKATDRASGFQVKRFAASGKILPPP